MSQPKKPKDTITNYAIYYRLDRLGFTKLPLDIFVAYVGLQLVNRGKVVGLKRAFKIIKETKLNEKIQVPQENIIESLIYLVIWKRKLIQTFIEHPEYDVWNDEITAPLFEILKELQEIYKV